MTLSPRSLANLLRQLAVTAARLVSRQLECRPIKASVVAFGKALDERLELVGFGPGAVCPVSVPESCAGASWCYLISLDSAAHVREHRFRRVVLSGDGTGRATLRF